MATASCRKGKRRGSKYQITVKYSTNHVELCLRRVASINVDKIGQVLDRVLLRRTKEGRSEDIVLPPKTIVLRKVLCPLTSV
jgi:hypothetical protein